MAIRDSYDYIVVGGGSSGAAVAARLSENPDVTVALLEAGPDDRKYDEVLSLKRWPELLESGLDWDYPIEEQENGNSFMRHARAKVLGGCSSHNSCIAFHTPAEDLEIWEKLGANNWNPENVLPLIKKLETNSREGDQYGHDGPVEIMDVPQVDPVGTAVLDACEEAGLPRKKFNTGETVKHGAEFFQINSHKDNTRSSSAVSYLHPNEKRENLDILTDMWVTRILFADDDTNTATGVEYLADSFNRKATISANKEVIISAGAINSPQLLMLSGIGPREHLEEFNIDVRVDAPGVGSNLQDHPEAVIQFETKVPMVRDSTQWWEIGIFTQIDDDTDLPDLMMHYGCTPFDMHTARQGYPQADEVFALTPNVCHARSRGTVRLRSNDYRDKPKVDPRYFTDEEGYDMRIAVEGIKLARKIADQPALKDIVARELSPGADVQSDEDIADYISKTHNTVYHPVGTVRMGSEDDEMSPLDPELRVKGTKNLRVADASVMPQIVAVNPNITCYVIGERAAQLIAGEA
ncbi:GMC family oxidoreductase [uncultured Corynebacterium sp.]|uniref:GMC family oxidoreductase n=1 Tax=uncultured Corynebacterium sp. TaxID=159447 RepID=UPI00262782CA|nr:GMC family oxidoreductase N-terminal domain-containing protein [uncultured Corynebacterium sp.]